MELFDESCRWEGKRKLIGILLKASQMEVLLQPLMKFEIIFQICNNNFKSECFMDISDIKIMNAECWEKRYKDIQL